MEEETKNLYLFPIKKDRFLQEESTRLSSDFNKEKVKEISGYKTWKYSPAHIGIFSEAVDIFVPEGTEVLATEDGIVLELVEHHNEYGNNLKYKDLVNYCSIQHSNGEISQYAHLRKNSFLEKEIRVGSKVKKGQVISRTGRNGWMSHDHLHYVIFKTINGNLKSLVINFES
jgi:murein DD-endopeptidase MepM/ murein hydrolase activator NlpD